MKLSEILKTSEKYDVTPNFTGEELLEPNSRNIQFQYGYNTALTSCDREIDREALKEIINKFYHLQLEESGALADRIISTMPTWLKPTERK